MAAAIPNPVIGAIATYQGTAHPYLRGLAVCVVAVVKRPDGDRDAGSVLYSNDDLVAAGGLDPEHDILEVVGWLGAPYHRWGAVPSDVRLSELHDLREAP